MKHISHTFVYIIQTFLRLTAFTKTLPQNVISHIYLCYFFRTVAPPMILLTAGVLTEPQIPATASNVCANDAWLGGVGRVPPPNKNPGYAGDLSWTPNSRINHPCVSHRIGCLEYIAKNMYNANLLLRSCTILGKVILIARWSIMYWQLTSYSFDNGKSFVGLNNGDSNGHGEITIILCLTHNFPVTLYFFIN